MAETRVMTILAVVASLAVAASGATHVVGGSGTGWTIPSSTSFYSQWASSQTFTIGDTLVFNFTTGLHNVMEVPKSSYDGCSSANRIGAALTSGPATVTLTKPGSHYYICGVTGHCLIGQKLAISVGPSPSSTPAPAPAPTPTSAPASAPTTTPTAAPALPPAPAFGGPTAAVAPNPSSGSGSNGLATSSPVGGPRIAPAAQTGASAGPTQNPTAVAGPSDGGPNSSASPLLSSEYLGSMAIASLLSATVAFLL